MVVDAAPAVLGWAGHPLSGQLIILSCSVPFRFWESGPPLNRLLGRPEDVAGRCSPIEREAVRVSLPAMRRFPSALGRHRPGILGLLLLLMAWMPAPAADAPATGVIPYRTLAKLFDAFAAVKPQDKLNLHVRVLPAGKTPPAQPIQLEIRSRTGTLPVKRSASGDLEDFPLTEELRKENPGVVSNQPKGTLVLKAFIGIRYSGQKSEMASWYRDALDQANAALKQQGGWFSLTTPTLRTLVLTFDPGSQAVVIVRADGTEKEFRSDELGRVRLEVGRDLAAPEARILFPEAPLSITAE